MSKKISSGLIAFAFAFAAALLFAGPAEAGPLIGGTAESEASPWSLAWAWLTEVWGDLTGLHDATATDSLEMDGTCSGECSSSGYGIDPNGQGSGG